ncbi:hypothetical protein [Candidatus Nitrospira bockiana]
MTADEPGHRGPVIEEILRYVVEHPEAKDTIEGIARWWVRADDRRWPRELVHEAVEELVARGWIVRRETTASHVVYGLNKPHLETIVHALKRRPGDETDR